MAVKWDALGSSPALPWERWVTATSRARLGAPACTKPPPRATLRVSSPSAAAASCFSTNACSSGHGARYGRPVRQSTVALTHHTQTPPSQFARPPGGVPLAVFSSPSPHTAPSRCAASGLPHHASVVPPPSARHTTHRLYPPCSPPPETREESAIRRRPRPTLWLTAGADRRTDASVGRSACDGRLGKATRARVRAAAAVDPRTEET